MYFIRALCPASLRQICPSTPQSYTGAIVAGTVVAGVVAGVVTGVVVGVVAGTVAGGVVSTGFVAGAVVAGASVTGGTEGSVASVATGAVVAAVPPVAGAMMGSVPIELSAILLLVSEVQPANKPTTINAIRSKSVILCVFMLPSSNKKVRSRSYALKKRITPVAATQVFGG